MTKEIIKIAKKVIKTEINGLEILSKKINLNFAKAVNILKNTKGKIIITGVGKSGIIAKKLLLLYHPQDHHHNLFIQQKLVMEIWEWLEIKMLF